MKTKMVVFLSLGLLLLTACNVAASNAKDEVPLALTLEITQKEVKSFDEIECWVYLSNRGDSSLLVNKRLFSLPFQAPSSAAEMLILISDSSGTFVANESLSPNYDWPTADMLNRLQPGEQVKKRIYLDGVGFWASLFNEGETYTIVAVYQSEFNVRKTIDGEEVFAWVGTIRSNEETFIILPSE